MNTTRHEYAVLAEYTGDFRPLSVTCLGTGGGFSGAQLWRVDTPQGLLCLRKWPIEQPTHERLALIHAVLWHVHQQGFRVVPVPVITRHRTTIVEHAGHLWELSPWMPGRADFHEHPTPQRLRAAMTSLACFHLASVTFKTAEPARGVSSGIIARRQQLHGLLAGGATELHAALRNTDWPELSHLAVRWLALLPRAAPQVDQLLAEAARLSVALQPCLRDIWHDHVLFTGEQVSGIVDFGALRMETIAGDIARLLGSLVEDDADGWQEGIAAYNSLRMLSSDERQLINTFDASGILLSPANWFRWVFVEQRSFHDRGGVVRRVETLLTRLARRLGSNKVILP